MFADNPVNVISVPAMSCLSATTSVEPGHSGDNAHVEDRNKGQSESPKNSPESEILPKPGSSVKTKTMAALNFQCKHCSKVYTTNPGILKHLRCDHNITEETPVLHYTSFMGKRRIKVQAKPVENDSSRKSLEDKNGVRLND